jgi:hypothetical protein
MPPRNSLQKLAAARNFDVMLGRVEYTPIRVVKNK